MLTEIFFIAVSYLAGSFPTSAIIAKIKGVPDLTKKGSGNLGATNVARVIGKKFGLLTLAIDALKGFIPAIVALRMFPLSSPPFPLSQAILALVIIAPVAGHCYSAFIGFKGGKGVATALGVFLALSPVAVGIALTIFITVLLFSKYVSLASIVSGFFMPFLIFYALMNPYMFGAAAAISALIIYKHSANIRRLLDGTENRFTLSNPDKPRT